MVKIIFSAALLFISIFSFAQDNKVVNDKNAQKRNVSGFHAIRISNGIDLYLAQGDETVVVSASDLEVRERIKTVVENGVLKIYIENRDGFHWNWGNQHMRAYVSFKTLDNLEASGGSDVFTQGAIKADKLRVGLSGGSDFKGEVNASDLDIHQSGGSDVHISGTVANLNIDASGGSDFHGANLSTDFCNIDASGGSDMDVNVSKELNVSASGGSDVHYRGSAVIRKMSTSGSSSISKKGSR
ncbi:MAG TPA: head GIN domain-containing protein [Puia sp.]|nr:head GIN domain-containing protein [Puia sp.]